MTTTFRCKEPGCAEVLEYEPITIPGGIGAQRLDQVPQKDEVPGSFVLQQVSVYLICDRGHVHQYRVTPKTGGAVNVR